MVNNRGVDNKKMSGRSYLLFTLVCAMTVLTSITAQIKFYIGIIPYTVQNFAVILSGLILGKYGFLPQILYLVLIALGLPVSARGGGIGVLLGYTAGYLWMFPVSAFITGFIRKIVWKNGCKRELFLIWLGSVLAVVPLYAFGFYVFYRWVTGFNSAYYGWCESVTKIFGLDLNPFWTVFFASVVVFVPQDLFVDHVLAVLVFRYVVTLLKEKGFELP
jgi:biotin transport system substrate-specific component